MSIFFQRMLVALVVCIVSIGPSVADEPLETAGQKSESELRADAESQSQKKQVDDLLKTCERLVRLVDSRGSVEQTCEIEDFVALQLINANQLEVCLPHAKRSLALSESHFGKEHWQTVSRRWSLDYVNKLQAAPPETFQQMLEIEARYNELLAAEKHAQAAAEIEKLAPLETETLGAEHPFSANTWASQADCWITAGKYEAAEEAATKAFTIRRKQLGEKHPSTALAAWSLAQAQVNQEKHAAALEYLELAAEVSRATGSPLEAAWIDSWRADSLAALNRFDDAEKTYESVAGQFTALNQHGRPLWQMLRSRSECITNAGRKAEGIEVFFAAVDALEKAEDVSDKELRDELEVVILAARQAENGTTELKIDSKISDLEKRAIRRKIAHLEKMGSRELLISEISFLRQRLVVAGLKEEAEKETSELFATARSMIDQSLSPTELSAVINALDPVSTELESSGDLGPARICCEIAFALSERLPKADAIGFQVELLGKQLSIAISGGDTERTKAVASSIRVLLSQYLKRLALYSQEVPVIEFGTDRQHGSIVVMSYVYASTVLVLKPVTDDISMAVKLAGELDAILEQISGILAKQDNVNEFVRQVHNRRAIIWTRIQNRLIGDKPEVLPQDRRQYVELMARNASKASASTESDANLWALYAEAMQAGAKFQALSAEEREDERILKPIVKEISAVAAKLREQPLIFQRDVAVQILMMCSLADLADQNFESVVKTSNEAADMLEQFVLRTGGPPQEIIARSQQLRSGLDPYTMGLMASALNDDPKNAFEFAARGRSLGSRIAWQRTRDLSNVLTKESRPAWLPQAGRLSLEEEYSAAPGLEGQGLPGKAFGDQIASILKPDERYILISTLHGTLAGPDHIISSDVGLFFIRPRTHSKPGVQFFERGIGSAVANESIPTNGVYVTNVVTDSTASQMGIRPGDIIQEVGGAAVTHESFKDELQKTSSDQNLDFKVFRDGEVIELTRSKPAQSLGTLFATNTPREAERQSREITSPRLAEARTFQVSALSNRGWATRSSRSAKLIEKDDSPELSAKGESWRLFKSLIPPEVWEELKGVRKVYLSVPGQLAGLPLETLVVEPPSGNALETDTARWIDVGPHIVYLPFASVVPVDKEADVQPAKLAYLGIGDVDFTSVEGIELPRLPNTRREVESISKVHEKDSTKLLLGPDASEEELYDNAPEAGVLSIATHGQSKDGLDTLESCLVLGATTSRGGSEFPERRDGRLTLRDLLTDWRGRLRATKLTILSACQTGGGLVTQDDGSVGLPFGFLAAGSSAVIASQWPVDDVITADLFSQMFSDQGDSEDMLSAFTKARKKLRAQHPDPNLWAPFIYISSH